VIDPKGEETEYQGPVSSYQVVQTKESPSDVRFVAAEADATDEENADGDKQTVAGKAPAARSAGSARSQRRRRSRTKLYAAVGVGLGILAAGIGAFFIHTPKADGSFDFGSVTANANGLKGHLITNWGDQLDYKLTVEPSDAIQQAAFQNAVANPPHPLSIDIQLKDAKGQVLCNHPVLLKFNLMKNNARATTEPGPKGKKFDEVSADREQVTVALNNARLVGQELSREHGKDLFQNKVGTDGEIESISAQGTMPCTKQQYETTNSWALTSNFPIIVPAAGSHGPGSGLDGDLSAYAGYPDKSKDTPSTPARMKRKVALPAPSHFSIEEDDAVVGFQPATGIIETRAGKAFQMEKRHGQAQAELRSRSITGATSLEPALAGVGSIQRAWMER
jgi:hypothetical protein